MKKPVIYTLFFVAVLLSACSTELDVLGRYKETLVVYGLLDQSQSKQYIKINKAFLGEGNAFTYAQIKDSTQFTHSLNVKIIRNSDGVEFTLNPDNTIPKDPGIFYAPDQNNVIYTLNTPLTGTPNLSTPDPNDSIYSNSVLTNLNDYKLVVKNSDSGTEVSAQTSLLYDAIITTPTVGSVSSTFAFVTNTNPNPNFTITWTTGRNARMYQAILRFNYIDSSMSGTQTNHIDWVFPVQTTQGLAGNESMTEQFKGQSFLQFIGNQLNGKPIPTYYRRALKTDIILVSGADDLNTYIEVNTPSTGIVQEKPEYTNVTNGLGIFSSKYNRAPLSKLLNGPTLDELACGEFTKTLKFLNANGILPQCP